MNGRVPRGEVITFLRNHNFHYDRQADRVEIYRQKGTAVYVGVPRRDLFTILVVRTVLSNAKFSAATIDAFLSSATKVDGQQH
ncbi:MAG: hypothetical protein AB7G23_19110 [Vicinamibacterales bacterium]